MHRAAPVLGPVLDDISKRYGLLKLPVRTGIHEELFVITAERQFSHEGQRVIARLAGEISGKEKSRPGTKTGAA